MVVCGSAALVLLLGARAKLTAGPVRLLLSSPWRALIWTAALAVLRIVIGRRLPPFPAAPRGTLAARFEAERRRFGTPPARPRGFVAYAAAVALTSLLWFAPHVMHLRQIPHPGDPGFSARTVARVAHQLAHDPAHLFDGNIFFPERWTLTYSDATILEALAGAPFILAGADPLIVSNAVFLAAIPLCALAFFHAAWRVTGHLQASFVAGLLGAL